jgi:hypothetical protein
MRLAVICILMLLVFVVSVSGYEWDGAAWADNTKFMSLITQEIKDNYQAIRASAKGLTRAEGRMGQIGDSITYSMAYFTGVMGSTPAPNDTGHDYDPIRTWLCEGTPGGGSWYNTVNGADRNGKGTEYCCMSGWRVSNATGDSHPDKFMNIGRNAIPGNYSWCIVMYGTNDVDIWAGDLVAESNTWKAAYKAFVQDIINEGCIPVLSTIPPEHDWTGDAPKPRYEIANDRIKEICKELKLAYVDYYAMILHHQPGDAWDGEFHGVDRLIGTDGTHPSNVGGSNNFSQTALTWDGGYAARTKLTLDMAEKIKEIVFDNGPAEKKASSDSGGDSFGCVAGKDSPSASTAFMFMVAFFIIFLLLRTLRAQSNTNVI